MDEMTAKQRLLAAIRGQEVDRMPWSPFLAYYWDFCDPEIIKKGQFAYLKGLGADPLLRGFHQLFRLERNNCEVKEVTQGTYRTVTYETPVGTLRERYTYASSSNTWFLTDHPVSTEEDVKVLQYIFEHTRVLPDYAQFEADCREYGDDALAIPVIGSNLKTAMQSLVEHWFGTVELIYGLEDYPEAIEECLETIRAVDTETVKISLDSSAEGFIFWEDSSTTNLNPRLFAKYVAPQVDQWGKMIHKEGKLLLHHACGHIRDLIPIMATTAIDAIESISPPPTGNIEVAEAFAKLPQHIALIGGIEPTVLLNAPMDELEAYVQNLLDVTRGRRYVLANSDSCPPYVEEEKFRMISRMVRR